jgi:uncharacterized protein with HEPN domain
MLPKTRGILEDIHVAASFISNATRGKSLSDYKSDQMLRFAVERNFEIIGEAVARLVRHDPSLKDRIVDYAQIISFRNTLIHGYDMVDHAQVWKVITTHLPALIVEVHQMLGGDDYTASGDRVPPDS